ncbi:hypothetical protein FF38_03238 [Lucilia cuprina]|uniref:Uncharacterized protein n=1 Tax=Lucilia cuprina TaxID=7375 RepID=A0A0L0BP79_LUCCU|nr:hypothetical protein FF38_03238 [Lucilia cuprina]
MYQVENIKENVVDKVVDRRVDKDRHRWRMLHKYNHNRYKVNNRVVVNYDNWLAQDGDRSEIKKIIMQYKNFNLIFLEESKNLQIYYVKSPWVVAVTVVVFNSDISSIKRSATGSKVSESSSSITSSPSKTSVSFKDLLRRPNEGSCLPAGPGQ